MNETAIKYDVTDDNINDWEEFTRLRKRAVKKQEAYLVKQGTKGRINQVMAIFRLKQPQHGYSDKQEFEHSGEVQFLNGVPRPKDEKSTSS